MANSLFTGVAGLASHQKMIEIVGNNLANLNTVGFKSRTAVFSDVLYETVRGGTGGAAGVSGGTNPIQIGTGSKLSTMRTNFTSGNMEATGGDLDLAIDGDGFFVVNSGTGPLYTRAGTFQIDKNGLLVDSATGYPVQRFGLVGEPYGTEPAFQTAGNTNIQIPIGAAIPGAATKSITVTGNLPYNGAAPTTEVLESSPWTTGSAAAVEGTLLNDLDFITTPFQAGDTLTISGTDVDGSAVSVSLAVNGSTTVGDLLAQLNTSFTGATASLGTDGRLSLTADEPGEAFLSLSFKNGTANVGEADFTAAPLVVSTAGRGGETVRGGLPVYDERGGVHTINFEFTKQADQTWTFTATMDPADGTVLDGVVSGITFGSNGAFVSADASGIGDMLLKIQFVGQTEPSTLDVKFSSGDGQINNSLNSLAGQGAVAAFQDGRANGVLTSVQVDSTGMLKGIASNGRSFPLAQLAISSFRNAQGLESAGSNFFRSSLSSGDAQLGVASSNGRGVVQSGQLEQSNVEIAVEFTRLIIAQRGFSANARTITVTNDMLQELTNLIR
ncbi:flagellar hook protein FlgE [Planctomicrobium sp. SH664]|uniref:flagellar hook protein FlgE n=1 Tax=Planctomicrobium sp. SH664 TaxID=3448125 RepID=UPI003F5CAA75